MQGTLIHLTNVYKPPTMPKLQSPQILDCSEWPISQTLAKLYRSLKAGKNLIFYFVLKDVSFHFLFRDEPRVGLQLRTPKTLFHHRDPMRQRPQC